MAESEEQSRSVAEPAGPTAAHTRRPGGAAAAARIQQQSTWVDLQVKQAIDRGHFDDLPGAGKPIPDLDAEHDPDWWLKKLIEREQVTGVLPASVQLRKDDAELDARLDATPNEKVAREIVEEFNKRVIAARYSLPEGPPLITMPRDVDATLTAWRERLQQRRSTAASVPPQPRRRWFRRSDRSRGRSDPPPSDQ